MGCQNICQHPSTDDKLVISDNNQNRQNLAYSRNVNKKNYLNNPDFKTLSETYKCSLNILETIVDKDMLRFTIKASNIHKMIPVWIDRNTIISFHVAGVWSFQESTEFFDSTGCVNFEDKPNGMHFGCLAAYIPGGPYFNVYDGLVLEVQKEGPLFMFQNNGLYSVNPKGSLEVEIKGVTPLSIYEIEMKLGWDLSELDTSIPEMKEDEINLLIYINKVRTNPKLFAQQYLNNANIQNNLYATEAEKELFNILCNMDPINKLKTSSELYRISLNHARDLGENKLAGHESSSGANMEQRLMANGINTKIFAENCIFGYNDPLEIILKLLIDEDNDNRNQRKIILNKDFNMVGISIEPHTGEYCWSCIQDFIMDLPYQE